MGMASAAVQVGQTTANNNSSGKGGSPAPVPTSAAPKPLDGVSKGYAPQPMGKGGTQTNSATSGQPRVGQANQYSNTVGVGDNTQQQTQASPFAGKSKGA